MRWKLCKKCDAPFVAAAGQRRFCSDACRYRDKHDKRRARSGLIQLSAAPVESCERCGKPVSARRRTRRFCSHACAAVVRLESAVTCSQHECQALAHAKGLCQTHYGQRHRVMLDLDGRAPVAYFIEYAGACAECGKPWAAFAVPNRRFCSDKCRNRAFSRNRNHRRRSVGYGFAKRWATRANAEALMQRAKGRCEWCRCETPLYLRGTTHPCAPEVDHVVPLSRGGHHADWNLQLLCRACNSKKSDRIVWPLVVVAVLRRLRHHAALAA